MLLSLLTTSTKTRAANSSTALMSSYRMVCRTQKTTPTILITVKKNQIFTVRIIIYGTIEVELHSILTLELDPVNSQAYTPAALLQQKEKLTPPPPLKRMLGGPHNTHTHTHYGEKNRLRLFENRMCVMDCIWQSKGESAEYN
jgi:hypothetical protein